jgi:hypothetical protein
MSHNHEHTRLNAHLLTSVPQMMGVVIVCQLHHIWTFVVASHFPFPSHFVKLTTKITMTLDMLYHYLPVSCLVEMHANHTCSAHKVKCVEQLAPVLPLVEEILQGEPCA